MGNTTHPEFFIFFLSFSFLRTSESCSDPNIFLIFSFFSFGTLFCGEKYLGYMYVCVIIA